MTVLHFLTTAYDFTFPLYLFAAWMHKPWVFQYALNKNYQLHCTIKFSNQTIIKSAAFCARSFLLSKIFYIVTWIEYNVFTW